MKIPGVELDTVNPKWRMRIRPWLNMKSLKPEYSVEVHHPEFKIWLTIYAKKRGLRTFKSEIAAKDFIAELKARPQQGATA
ncbi:TPA: hypothetical protein QDC06_000838 [Burkholderia cepacia]|nr:hypothetical protein BZY94_00945 [Burkholderia territorii]HDR9497636.1 hypothetical protein [Burkholderia cepacia]